MIRAQNLSKFYGTKRALGPISFTIEDGETVGFLGLNGAGKTTALRIFACDLRPSMGSVAVGPVDAIREPHEVRKRIGFLPETPPLYHDMLVKEYLLFVGRLQEMSAAAVRSRLPEVLEQTDLTEVADEIIGTLSHGFKQRVGVAQAIVHDPDLLILDEPTRGLDPMQIVEMRRLIENLKGQHTVLISSHLLTEISETCDRVLVLNQGQILDTLTLKDKMRRLSIKVGGSVKQKDKVKAVIQSLSGANNVELVGTENDLLHFELDLDNDLRAPLAKALVNAGFDLIELVAAVHKLESIFVNLVKGAKA